MKQSILFPIIFFMISSAFADKIYLRDGRVYEGEYKGIVEGRVIFHYSHTDEQLKFFTYSITKVSDNDGKIIITGEEIISQIQSELQKNPFKKVAFAIQGISITRERVLSLWAQPTYLNMKGFDLFVLDEILQKRIFSAPGVISSTETETRSINMKHDHMWTQKFGFEYNFGGRTSILGNALLFSAAAKESGVFEAPAPTDTVQYKNEVFLWEGNYSDTSGQNFYFPHGWYGSGFSPIEWLGNIDEKVISADLYASYGLLMKKNYNLNINFGLEFLSFSQNLNRYIRGERYYFDLRMVQAVVYNYQDRDTLFTQNLAKMDLSTGPYFGFSGKVQYRKLSLQGSLSRTSMSMKTNTKGVFAEVGEYIWRSPFGLGDEWVSYDSSSTFDKTIKTTIPIYKAYLSVNYQLFEKWDLGIGAYYSIYQDIPTVPTFNHKETTWIEHSNDISFSGIKLIIRYNMLLP